MGVRSLLLFHLSTKDYVLHFWYRFQFFLAILLYPPHRLFIQMECRKGRFFLMTNVFKWLKTHALLSPSPCHLLLSPTLLFPFE